MSADDPKDYRSLGEILRDARESQEKSLEDMSEVTKISPKVLTAIEADDLDQVADPIYAKSFVRTLAEALDLDADWLLTKLEHASASREATPVEQGESELDDTTWHIEDVRIQKVATPKPRTFPRLVVGVIVGAVLAAAGFWLIQRNSDSSGAAQDASVRSREPRQAALVQAPPRDVVPEDEDSPSQAEGTTPGEVVDAVDAASTAEQDPPQEQPTPKPAEAEKVETVETVEAVQDEPSPEPVEEQSPSEQEAPAQANPAPAEEQPAPARATTAPDEEVVVTEERRGLPSIVRPGDAVEVSTSMKLVLTATGKVDLTVAADGKGRRLRTLNQGQTWTVEGRDHFSLEISDADRVLVELDGIRRDPPPGLSGEWILYPNPSPR